jgi:serpin B
MELGAKLRELGMTTAFDVPRGSANFERMAPQKPNSYLAISEVFHKTFLNLDEKGTEAAAATAVTVFRATSAIGVKPKPILVRVDRPFLFAIHHRPSRACLFLGRVVDPR